MKIKLRSDMSPEARAIWETAKWAKAQVEMWPAWKRGLPPCKDSRCERELGHAGRHRCAKPVEYLEWD